MSDIITFPEFDDRNLIDRLKGWSDDVIRADVADRAHEFSVLLINTKYDINIGATVRSANGLGAQKVYIYGARKFNRVPAMGTYHYTPVQHINSYEELLDLKWNYHFVALELTDKAQSIHEYQWKKNTLMILGNESEGIPEEILRLADDVVMIPLYGSVRSINLTCAASIAMNDFISKKVNNVF